MMKKISIISVFAGLLIGLVSCENDTDPVASAQGLQLSKDAAVVTPSELNTGIDANNCIKLDWGQANNGVSSVSTYQIIISDHDVPFVPDGDEKNVVEFNWVTPENPNNRTYTALNSEVNAWMNKLPSFNCGTMNIDFRIRSLLGNNPNNSNNLVQYSNPITVSIKGYPKSQKILALVKDGSNAADAPQIKSSASSSDSDYEGYMYLEAGNYKFYQPDGCGSFANPTIYGINAGTLTEGSSDTFNVTTAGYYSVKANLAGTTKTCAIKYYRAFGVIGKGVKSLGFDNMVPMDAGDLPNIWKITLDLFKGRKIRFRSSDWTGNLTGTPPSVPSTATLVTILGKATSIGVLTDVTGTTSGDITVPGTDDGTKQKYYITIDVRNPRDYKYTLQAVNN